MRIDPQAVAAAMGGPKTIGRKVDSMLDLNSVLIDGLPRAALDYLADELVFPASGRKRKSEFIVRYVPRATYQRSEKLNLNHGETVERIARLYAMLLEIFEDKDSAREFLNKPHPELGDQIPLELARTEVGGRAVEELLDKGLHGLPV